MEVVGFVLVSTRISKEREVLDKLTTLPCVSEAHHLFGEYDIIAKLVADSHTKLGEIVVDQVRRIDGVIDTVTLASIGLR